MVQGMGVAAWGLIAGCQATSDSVPSLRRLSSRVGKWNYEDALAELGPPIQSVELRDHSRVAEWPAGSDGVPTFTFRVESSDGSQSSASKDTGNGESFRIFRQLQFDQSGRLIEVRDVLR